MKVLAASIALVGMGLLVGSNNASAADKAKKATAAAEKKADEAKADADKAEAKAEHADAKAEKADEAADKAKADADKAKAESDKAAADADQAKAQADKAKEASKGGLLGPVSLGPTIGLAIPHLLNLGIEGRVWDYLGFAVDYGFIPQISFGDAKLKMSSPDIRARVFPFGGSFFLGASFGRQNITASNTVSTTVAGQAVSTTVELGVNTWYLQPTLGWRWGGRSGFIFGMDFGYQMAVSSSSELSLSTPVSGIETTAEYIKAKADAEKVGNDIGKTSLPAFTMIHIGYLF